MKIIWFYRCYFLMCEFLKFSLRLKLLKISLLIHCLTCFNAKVNRLFGRLQFDRSHLHPIIPRLQNKLARIAIGSSVGSTSCHHFSRCSLDYFCHGILKFAIVGSFDE